MKINRIFGALLLALSMTGFQACSDVENPTVDTGLRTGNASKIEVYRDSEPVSDLTFSIGKGNAMLGIDADGNWTAELADDSWCKLVVHAGYGYTNKWSYTKLEVAKNEGGERATTLTIKFKTKDNINTVYTYNVKVAPTVWTAGKTADNKPILWRNWEDKSMYLSGRASYTSANEVIVHGSTAFVMMRKDVSNSYTEYASGTAVILKGTGVHGGGYLNTYKDGLTGASKKYCVYTKPGTTRYIAGIPHMWVDKNNNVYYTSAFRDNNTDNCDNWVSTNVYKNKTLLRTDAGLIINDLATDDSGNLYYVGINSNFGVYDEILSVPYIYLGDATGYLAKLTTSNNLSIYPWSRYLFNTQYFSHCIADF